MLVADDGREGVTGAGIAGEGEEKCGKRAELHTSS
jgi:hypothetical protein